MGILNYFSERIKRRNAHKEKYKNKYDYTLKELIHSNSCHMKVGRVKLRTLKAVAKKQAKWHCYYN